MPDFFMFFSGKTFPIIISLLIAVPSALLFFYFIFANEKAKKKSLAKERLRVWREIREREKPKEPDRPAQKALPPLKTTEQYAKAGWRKIIRLKKPEAK